MTIQPNLPGSRSIANRALVAAALARGQSTIQGVTPCGDTFAMKEGLKAFGAKIQRIPKTNPKKEDNLEDWKVSGLNGRPKTPSAIHAGDSGTTARFLTAVCAIADPGTILLDGSPRMRERPIGELTDALCQLGVQIESLRAGGIPTSANPACT